MLRFQVAFYKITSYWHAKKMVFQGLRMNLAHFLNQIVNSFFLQIKSNRDDTQEIPHLYLFI